MRLLIARYAAFALLGSASLAHAQNPKPAPADDLRSIRQLLEQQGRQIDVLTQQVAKLSQLLEAAHPSPPPAQNMPPAPESSPAAPSPAPASASSGSPEPPKAEPVDVGTTHVVTRGETLTSIARLYKVSVGDLQKTNNIHNDRTLQIGQTLTIPSAKSGDSHKKEKQ